MAIAKRDLEPGQTIERGIGGFDVRGEAARFAEQMQAVPIGLLDGARISRGVGRGQVLGWDDVEVKEGLARDAALEITRRVLDAESLSATLPQYS